VAEFKAANKMEKERQRASLSSNRSSTGKDSNPSITSAQDAGAKAAPEVVPEPVTSAPAAQTA
jgi:hypothetical protein